MEIISQELTRFYKEWEQEDTLRYEPDAREVGQYDVLVQTERVASILIQ